MSRRRCCPAARSPIAGLPGQAAPQGPSDRIVSPDGTTSAIAGNDNDFEINNSRGSSGWQLNEHGNEPHDHAMREYLNLALDHFE